MLAMGLRGMHGEHFLDQRLDVHLHLLEFELAGFDLGEVENVIDQ